jgi:hypothetical protein
MKQIRVFGMICAIISQIFGVGYLFYGIAVYGFTPDEAATTVTTLIQLALVVTLIFAFYLEKRMLIFGASLISMCFSGISYLADDASVFTSFQEPYLSEDSALSALVNQQPFSPYLWAHILYLIVDFAWVVNLVLVFLMAFSEKERRFHKISAILFLTSGVVLWVALIFYGIAGCFLDMVGSIGDSFALIEYGLALLFVFHDSPSLLGQNHQPSSI